MLFFFVQTLTLVLIICTSALHLYLLTKQSGVGFRQALGKGAGSAVAFCMSICVIWPVAALMSYHMRVSGMISFLIFLFLFFSLLYLWVAHCTICCPASFWAYFSFFGFIMSVVWVCDLYHIINLFLLTPYL